MHGETLKCRKIVREARKDTTLSAPEMNKSLVNCTAHHLLPFFTDGDPVDSEGDGKISGGVAVDDEVEVFNVPQANEEIYPGSGQPDGGYPGLYPSWWYPVVYATVG